MSELAHKYNFYKAVQEKIKGGQTIKAAYEDVEQVYYAKNGDFRFSSFESFSSAYYKLIKERKI